MTPRSKRFTTPALGGVTLHAVSWGEASRPPLVLLHGGGANARWWDRVAPALAGSFRVTALDFRGHGDSDYPEMLESGAFHRDLEALLEHLGASSPILVGHSMGGQIALDHAARCRDVRGLAVIEVARGGDRRERRRTRLALAARRTYRSREEAVARFRLLPSAPGASEETRRSIAEHSVREETDGRFGFKFDARWFGLPPARRSDPAAIRCPVLVVRGQESGLLTAEGARDLVGGLADAQLVEVRGAGHNVHLERPDAVLRALDAFLARLC